MNQGIVETGHNDDFGFYYPDDLDKIAICAHNWREHHILPSVTMKELEEHEKLFIDVITYNSLYVELKNMQLEIEAKFNGG